MKKLNSILIGFSLLIIISSCEKKISKWSQAKCNKEEKKEEEKKHQKHFKKEEEKN